jgi:hypothetical protein
MDTLYIKGTHYFPLFPFPPFIFLSLRFIFQYSQRMNRYSSVSTLTGYGLDDEESIPERGKHFLLGC